MFKRMFADGAGFGSKNKGITCAMVMAAGLGTRLRPLTDTMPKPLVNVGGEPVIFRTLRYLKAAGIKHVVINSHYMAPMLEEAVRAFNATPAGQGLSIMFSREEQLLETGGGLKKALPMLGDNPFVVVNSDAVWCDDEMPLLRPLMKAFDLNKHDVLMSVVPVARVKDFRTDGDFTMDGQSHALTFNQDKALNTVVYTGIHVTHPAYITSLVGTVFGLREPWIELSKNNRLHGKLYDAPWVDMGSAAGLAYARALIAPQKA